MPSLPFFIYDRLVGTSLNAGGRAACVVEAKLALAHRSVLSGNQRAVRTDEYAGLTAHALRAIDANDPVALRYRACDTAFDAERIGAVTAGDGERDLVLFLNVYARKDLLPLEGGHLPEPRVRKGAVVFAQVTTETPFFIYIYTFHFYSPA